MSEDTPKEESAWVGIAKSFVKFVIYFLFWIGIGIFWGMNPLVAVNWAYLWVINSTVFLLLVFAFIMCIIGIVLLVVFLIEKVIDIRSR